MLDQDRLEAGREIRIVIRHQHHAARLDLVEHMQQILDRERLTEHAERAVLDRLRDELLEAEAGHHHDARIGADLLKLEERLDTVHARQLHIHENDIEILFAKDLDPLLAGKRGFDAVSAHRQDVGNAFCVITVIVDDQNPCRHAAIPLLVCASCFSRTVTLVPLPISLVIVIVPPCCSTICFTIGKPRPVPKLLVLKSGSNTFGKTSAAMPAPVSATANSQ